MNTSKSPAKVLSVAYAVAWRTIRPYSHRFSPKKFTQWQLFACLVLKTFLRLDYRKLAEVLKDSPSWRETIELEVVPHFTTFPKASRRLFHFQRARRLLKTTVHWAVRSRILPGRCPLAAMHGTGLESHHASQYYIGRCTKSGKREQKSHFPKMGLVCDCQSHVILAVVPGLGPGPDVKHFRNALNQALQVVRIRTLLADAGYDSESSHEYARNVCHVRTLIPATAGRPTKKPPSGYWRRQMKSRLHRTRYGQRWQVETTSSMVKRLLGSALTARTSWSQSREIFLLVLTLNIMILLLREVFYRAGASPF